MRGFLRGTLWTTFILLLVGIFLSIAVAVWLGRLCADPRLPGQVGEQLSRRLGAEVRFEKLGVAWPGWIVCHGAAIRLLEPPGDPLLAEIPSIRLLVSPLSLLTRQPEVILVHFVSPTIALRLTSGGRIALPAAFAGRRAHALETAPRRMLLPAIESFEISDGALRLVEADGATSFACRELSLRGGVCFAPEGAVARGRIKAGEIRLKNGALLNDVSSAITVSNALVHLSDMHAELEGAVIRASAAAFPTQGAHRFQVHARADGLSRAALGRFASIPAFATWDDASAEITGGATLGCPEALVATGTIRVARARLHPNLLLRTAGLGFAFPEWEEIDCGSTQGNLAVSNGWLRIAGIATAPASASIAGDLALGPAGESQSDFQGTLPLAGGNVRCRFTHRAETNAMPYRADISLERVSLPALLGALDVTVRHGRRTLRPSDHLSGALSGECSARGDLSRRTGTATGAVSIADCTLAGQKLLGDMAIRIPLPELRSVRFGTLRGSIAASGGIFRVDGLRPAGRPSAASLQTSFSILPGNGFDGNLALQLPVWQGSVGAKLSLKRSGPRDPLFSVAVDAANIDTGEMIKAFGGKPGALAGRAALRFQGTGNARDPAQIRGNGTVAVRPARMKGARILAVLGTLVSMPRLDSLDLDSLEADVSLSDRTIQFSRIRCTPETRTHFAGQGSLKFDGAVDMRGELIVNSGAPGFAANTLYSLGLKTVRGTFRIPFRVTGSAARPSVRLDTPGLPGSVASGAIDSIPLINRIPALFQKKAPSPTKP